MIKRSKYYLGPEEEQVVMDYVPADSEDADDWACGNALRGEGGDKLPSTDSG
jgi:hypothetical protein